MFRTAKFAFYIATLLFSWYLIEFTTLSPATGTGVAILFISGPEALEMWLLKRGNVPNQYERQTQTKERDRS